MPKEAFEGIWGNQFIQESNDKISRNQQSQISLTLIQNEETGVLLFPSLVVFFFFFLSF